MSGFITPGPAGAVGPMGPVGPAGASGVLPRPVIPPGVLPYSVDSFDSDELWLPLWLPQADLTMVRNPASVVIHYPGGAPDLHPGSGVCYLSGLLFKPIIYPDPNGQIQVEVALTNLNIGALDGGGVNRSSAGILKVTPGSIHIAGLGGRDAGVNPRMRYYGSTTYDLTANFGYTANPDVIDRIGAIYTLRWSLNMSSGPIDIAKWMVPVTAPGPGIDIDIDGGGFNACVIPPAWGIVQDRNTFMHGLRFGFALGFSDLMVGLAATFTRFAINKGQCSFM